jgi:WD40 repeat protein
MISRSLTLGATLVACTAPPAGVPRVPHAPASARAPGPAAAPITCPPIDAMPELAASAEAPASAEPSGAATAELRLLSAIGEHPSRPPFGVAAVAYSPDGCLLAAAGQRHDASVYVFDARTGELVRRFGIEHRASDVAFSPDGARLFAVRPGGALVSWDWRAGRWLGELPTLAFATGAELVLSVGGDRIAVSTSSPGPVIVLEPATGRRVFHAETRVFGARLSPDGQALALLTARDDRLVALQVAELDTGDVRQLRTLERAWPALAWLPGKQLAFHSGGQVRAIAMPHAWRNLRIDPLRALAASADGRVLAALTADELVVWRPEAAGAAGVAGTTGPGVLHRIPHRTFSFARVALSPDGSQVAFAGSELLVHDVATGARRFAPGIGADLGFAVTADGALVASLPIAAETADPQGPAVWDAAGALVARLDREPDVTWMAFAPDGRRLVGAGATRVVVWDVATGRAITRLEHAAAGERGRLTAARLAADGRRLALGVAGDAIDGGLLLLLDPFDAEAPPTSIATRASVHALVFAPDGRTLHAITMDSAVLAIDVRRGAIIRRTTGPSLGTAALTPDGSTVVATYANAYKLALLDARTSKVRRTLALPLPPSYDGRAIVAGALAAVPDGTLLVGNEEGDVEWIDRDGRRLAAPVHAHLGPFTGFEVVAGGTRLVTAGTDRRIRIWELAARR